MRAPTNGDQAALVGYVTEAIARVLAGATRWTVVQGDNLAIMRVMPPESVHLAYLDAPFFKQRDFKLADGRLAYSDKWPNFEAYLVHVMERCAAARDLLTDDGTLILHVDPSVSHYLKVALDGLFGRECFRNEIVWRYRRWPVSSRDFQRMHDILLRYTRSPDKERFNQLYEPLATSTIATFGTRKQLADSSSGRRRSSASAEESPGVPLPDVWEIGVIAPRSKERTGWPTQKPLELTDRLVLSCSRLGDVCLEPYAGSAPLTASAAVHGRRGIALDSSAIAVEGASTRLRSERPQADWLAAGGHVEPKRPSGAQAHMEPDGQ